jgi:hypothetical protein
MLQNLSKDIRECYLHAEECKRAAETARTPSAKAAILGWSVVGYRWPTATNFQNGYRISPCPSASANIRNNESSGAIPWATRRPALFTHSTRRV